MAAWAQGRVNGIPVLGFGTWPLRDKVAYDSVLAALEVGFRHIDTAQMYANEREVGEAVKASGLARADVFITSKVSPQVPPHQIAASIAQSVAALDSGPIDLMLLHWPLTDLAYFDAGIARLNEAQDQGLVKAIGISNCNVALMERAVKQSRHPILVNQVEFHPMLDQRKVQAAAARLGIAIEAYSPIARGAALTEPVIVKIAAARGVTPAEVVLGWIMAQGVIALPMTTKRANAQSNFNALKLQLSEAEMAEISSLRTQHRRLISPSGWAEWDKPDI
jgi:diketogulonate reductase-like aldo/keto reductase